VHVGVVFTLTPFLKNRIKSFLKIYILLFVLTQKAGKKVKAQTMLRRLCRSDQMIHLFIDFRARSLLLVDLQT
jgi:hypothetical protein